MKLTLVDGHNLILRVRELTERLEFDGRRASREQAEEAILAWASRASDLRVRIVYDGEEVEGSHPGSRDAGPMQVRFADPPAEADDVIRHEAREAVARGDVVTVVTGDKELARSVEALGARVIDPDAFFAEVVRVPPPADKEARFTRGEIEALHREMLARGEAPPPPEPPAAPAARVRLRPAPPTPSPSPKPKKPAAPPRPDKDGRRARYLEKQKKTRSDGAGRKPKKKRGF